MPFVAAINVDAKEGGTSQLLDALAPCFANHIATIRKKDDEWVLESSSFASCTTVDEVYREANALLSTIRKILALYMAWYDAKIYVSAVMKITDDGTITSRRIWSDSLRVNVVRSPTQVFSPTPSSSLATEVLSRAATDPAINEALSLIGDVTTDWHRVYDILEFLGETNSTTLGASRSHFRRVRQTANHYRHLGRQQGNPLPSHPPTLREAVQFATDLLKLWIAGRIA
jgi:hypothetical protein